jgi:hypothetical protein
MIYINHDVKAIFIHIPKTGGSYIGPTLVKYYGFKSYLPLLHKRRPDHDQICKSSQFKKVLTNNHVYNNSFFNKTIGILLYCKTSDYLNGLMNMNEEKWNTYTKFCFIRNPYNRVYSGWKHIKMVLNKQTSFYDYINQNKYNVSDIEYGHVFMNQKTQIQNEDGTCGMDIIGKFENLEKDFVKILHELGFAEIVHKPKKVNVSNKEESDFISLDIKTIRRLNEICEEDLDTFHYKKLLL